MIKNFISSLTLFLLLKNKLNWASAIFISLALFIILNLGRDKHSHLLSFETISRRSNFKSYDGAFKILFTFLSVILLIISKNLLSAILCFIFFVYILIIRDKIGIRSIISIISLPLFFISISVLSLAYELNLDNGINFYSSQASFRNARSMYFVILASYFLSLCLSLTSPLNSIIYGLKKLKLPSTIIELMLVIRTYITKTYNIFMKKSISASLREGDGGYRAKKRSFYLIAKSLLKDSLYASRRNMVALDARGFDGSVNFIRNDREIFPYYYLFLTITLIIILIGEKIGII